MGKNKRKSAFSMNTVELIKEVFVKEQVIKEQFVRELGRSSSGFLVFLLTFIQLVINQTNNKEFFLTVGIYEIPIVIDMILMFFIDLYKTYFGSTKGREKKGNFILMCNIFISFICIYYVVKQGNRADLLCTMFKGICSIVIILTAFWTLWKTVNIKEHNHLTKTSDGNSHEDPKFTEAFQKINDRYMMINDRYMMIDLEPPSVDNNPVK